MEVTINYNGQAVAVEVTLEVYEFLDRADHKTENLFHEQRRHWDGREFDEYIITTEGVGAYERFLSAMVNSGVRIMHIKREQKGVFFNGNESVLYMLKMNLLYRRIMFEVLGIDEAIYKNSLLKCVSRLDEWNGILKGFLSKLSL